MLHSQVLVYFDKLVKPGKTGRGKGKKAYLPQEVQQQVQKLHDQFPNHVFGEIEAESEYEPEEEDEGEEADEEDKGEGEEI